MVTLPIIGTILAAFAFLGGLVTGKLRTLIAVPFYIVTLWLCYSSPGGHAAMVCAIIYSSYCALAWIVALCTGSFQEKAAESGQSTGYLVGTGIFILCVGQVCMWIPWLYG